MVLKISVLLAAIAQVVGAAYLSIGTFETSERAITVFIQPASWAFSIWGLIYTLSFVYAIYQIIPSNENSTLKATRLPAIFGFLGSLLWLYFAGMEGLLVWLTIPTLFAIAIGFTFVVNAPNQNKNKDNILSKKLLFPYAAWTGIASWLNIPVVMVEEGVLTSEPLSFGLNLLLFVAIATFTLYYFNKTNRSLWYGGVLIWASLGVVAANIAEGSIVFAVLAGLLALIVLTSKLTDRKLLFKTRG